MDLKKLLLFLIRKFWVVLLAAVAGAFIGGGIYLLHYVALSSNREYQAESKVYLNFAPDDTGEVYQYYNGYTWNDLMSTDLILDTTMSYLPDYYTKEEVVQATKAEILSDVRLLTITITTQYIGRTAQILKATDQALVDMGQREKEFIDIEVIKETEPKMVVADPRLLQAVLVGCVIALVLVFIGMELFYILDDRIYVPGDLKCVTQIPFVGFSFSNEEDKSGFGIKSEDEVNKSENEIKTEDEFNGLEKTIKIKNEIKPEDKLNFDNKVKSDKNKKLIEKLQNDLEQNLAYLTKEIGELKTIELCKDNGVLERMLDGSQGTQNLLLVISYGKIDRSSLSYIIDQLLLRKCTLVGIIIKDADMRFLKWYYNHL